jgi:hypothetical protein
MIFHKLRISVVNTNLTVLSHPHEAQHVSNPGDSPPDASQYSREYHHDSFFGQYPQVCSSTVAFVAIGCCYYLKVNHDAQNVYN